MALCRQKNVNTHNTQTHTTPHTRSTDSAHLLIMGFLSNTILWLYFLSGARTRANGGTDTKRAGESIGGHPAVSTWFITPLPFIALLFPPLYTPSDTHMHTHTAHALTYLRHTGNVEKW